MRRAAAVDAAPVPADDVDRPAHRESRDRQAAGQRLDIDQPERVGPAGEDEQVRRGIGRRPAPRPCIGAEEGGLGIARLERGQRRAVADHDLGARDRAIEERLDILLRPRRARR